MAEKTELQILGIGTICPKCGSSQFSISVPNFRPAGWPRNVLGAADCRGCQKEFLVILAPELENALQQIIGIQVVYGQDSSIDILAARRLIHSLF